MTQRYATGIFIAAIATCWVSVWIAQSIPDRTTEAHLTVMPAAELAGVTRLVWDVDARYMPRNAHRDTLVLAGTRGDLRLSASPNRSQHGIPLKFVRKGDTIYVQGNVPEDANAQPDTDNPAPTADSPTSLALPATITEIRWPKVQLIMARAADIPALTIRSDGLVVGTTSRQKDYWGEHIDGQVLGDLQSDALPGKLRCLTAFSQLSTACSTSTNPPTLISGSFRYNGGFFSQITLLTQGGDVKLGPMESDMQLDLHASGNTKLEMDRLGNLTQVRVKDLSKAEADGLVSTLPGQDGTRCGATRIKY